MTHPWIKNYPSWVRPNLKFDDYNSIPEILEQSFNRYSDKDAFHNMGTTLTYGEIERLSADFASYLQNDLGLKKGDRVALMMPNILQYPIALFGLLRAGLTAVNVNPLYTARELEHQLNDSGAETIVLFSNSAHILEEVFARTKVKNVVLTQIGDMLKFPKNHIVNFVIKNVKKMVPDFNIPGAISFKDALSKGAKNTYTPGELSQSDVAFLQYTGGTTGVSKGAILSHGNILANMMQAREWIKENIVDGKEILITPLPLYHIFSLTANCFVFSSVGALNILITNPRDMPGFIKELAKWKFTAFTGVNTLFNGLTNHKDFSKLDFSKLHISLGGGMAVQKSVAKKWKDMTGCTLVEAYGLTETSPAACINPLDLEEYNGFIGLPISDTVVEIRDDENNTLEYGPENVGEICIKGPQVMKGYWNRPEETKKVMTDDGFFRTGDLGFMTEDGFTKIVDRKKDMILVSGFNVYPNEIEEVVTTHDKVFECAAVGVSDEKSGEVVKLFVVKGDESLTEKELLAFCKENFTGYKVPKFIEFRKELPKTPVGKILRKDLRVKIAS
ncbi:AMP-binding protein [bacterium]|nr:AMP-binding protein [bacterium]